MSAMRQKQFTVANLTLQTLVNTYPESNYARKARVVLQDAQIANAGNLGTPIQIAMAESRQVHRPLRDANSCARPVVRYRHLC